jgi:hypothetical protein
VKGVLYLLFGKEYQDQLVFEPRDGTDEHVLLLEVFLVIKSPIFIHNPFVTDHHLMVPG